MRRLSAWNVTSLFSQAVLVDRTMYIAGQIGIEPSNGQLVSGGIKEETKQVRCVLAIIFYAMLNVDSWKIEETQSILHNLQDEVKTINDSSAVVFHPSSLEVRETPVSHIRRNWCFESLSWHKTCSPSRSRVRLVDRMRWSCIVFTSNK